MSPVTRFLLRLFWRMAFPVGIALGVLATSGSLCVYAITGEGSIRVSLLAGLGFAVGGGLVIGLNMVLSGGWQQILAVKRLGYRLTDETLSLHQERELTIPLPFSETFTLCTNAIRHLGRTDIEEETDYSSGLILAHKRWSFTEGLAERIRFDLSADGDGTRVVIQSSPRDSGLLVDFGRGLKNVNAIVGFLLAHGANQVRDVPHPNPSAHVQLRPADDARCVRKEDVTGLGDSPRE